MEELVEKNTVPREAFPKLILRHAKELAQERSSEVVYHRQLHEMYMYTFFRSIKREAVCHIKIGRTEGFAMGPVSIGDLSLGNKLGEDEYFKFLLSSPLPFVFVPEGRLRDHSGMCKGASFFGDREQEGILMDLPFACNVGLDFLAAEYLARSDVSSVCIGLIRYL
jgi:hypothetical protein